jgi:hypothetical protein
MPAVEATRLCDKAPTDGILVSPATRLLAARVNGAQFESVGELELKGIPEPVEAFAVRWEPLQDEAYVETSTWPLPSLLRSVPRLSYVGRVAERDMVERARKATRDGQRSLVLVSGEPGIGKTRLAAYEALGAHQEGFAVIWGSCSEDLAVPYEPWIEVCSQLVEHAPEDLLVGMSPSRAPESGAWPATWRGGCPMRRLRSLRIRRRSASCCSRRLRSSCARPRRRSRCVWYSTTSTGPTGNRSRCSSMSRGRSVRARFRSS